MSADTDTAMNHFLRTQFPLLTKEHLALIDEFYPQGKKYPNAGRYWQSTSDAYGHMRYMCPAIYLSAVYAKKSIPSWNYRYNVEDPVSKANGLGVSHTIELTAIFGPEYSRGTAPASYYTINKNAVPLMQGYWTSFIRTYDPNVFRMEGSPRWEQWGGGMGMNRIRLETNTTAMEVVNPHLQARCEFFSRSGPSIHQ
jgi:carboxylesterase type B